MYFLTTVKEVNTKSYLTKNINQNYNGNFQTLLTLLIE